MIGKKIKIKGGLLSDLVSPAEFEQMTMAANMSEDNTENKEITPETETESKAKPEESADSTTPTATEDDASWKSRVSEPAAENTDDGNQGCKKSSNQSEYADEIGLAEINIDTPIESETIAVDMVDGLEDALEATDEIIEQKMIMDEAAAAGNLSVVSVSLFKEQAERYMTRMNGEGKGSFNGKYLDPDNSGLQSDNPESLRAGLQGAWDSVIQTIQGVINSLDKAGYALQNVLQDINFEIETKLTKEFGKLVWFPFKKLIESNVNKDKSFVFKKSTANRFIQANYSAAKLLLNTNDVKEKDLTKLITEVIDYFQEDKLPEVKKTDGNIEVSLKSMGDRGELENKAVKYLLDSIKKGEDGKSIFREIFSAADKLMISNTVDNISGASLTKKGHNPSEIKPEQIRAYALSNGRIYAIVFSKDGKNYLHDFIVDVPYNFIFGRGDNVQTQEDLIISANEMKTLVKKLDDGIKELAALNRGKQRQKIRDISKILDDDIKELKDMISKNEFSNWKLWKQYRQNIMSISRVYPQIIRLSAFGAVKHLALTGHALAGAKSVE